MPSTKIKESWTNFHSASRKYLTKKFIYSIKKRREEKISWMFYSFRETSPENPSNQTLLFVCESSDVCARNGGGGMFAQEREKSSLEPGPNLELVCMRKLTNWREWIVAEKKGEGDSKACSAQAQICEYLFWRGNLIFFPYILIPLNVNVIIIVMFSRTSNEISTKMFRCFQMLRGWLAHSHSLHALISKGFPSILVHRPLPRRTIGEPRKKGRKILKKSVFPHLKCPLHTLRTCALLFRGSFVRPILVSFTHSEWGK